MAYLYVGTLAAKRRADFEMPRLRRRMVLALAFAVWPGAGTLSWAQLPAPRDPTGTWVGSGTLTNRWQTSDGAQEWVCEYAGGLGSVVLELQQAGGNVYGNARLTGFTAVAARGLGGRSCPPLEKHYVVRGDVSGTRLTLTDPAGHRWSLGFTTSLLGGRVVWDSVGPYPHEALRAGVSLPDGETPLTRLSGSVSLRRRELIESARGQELRSVAAALRTAKSPPEMLPAATAALPPVPAEPEKPPAAASWSWMLEVSYGGPTGRYPQGPAVGALFRSAQECEADRSAKRASKLRELQSDAARRGGYRVTQRGDTVSVPFASYTFRPCEAR